MYGRVAGGEAVLDEEDLERGSEVDVDVAQAGRTGGRKRRVRVDGSGALVVPRWIDGEVDERVEEGERYVVGTKVQSFEVRAQLRKHQRVRSLGSETTCTFRMSSNVPRVEK